MVDGTLYVSTTQNHVAALDARSGRVLWTYTHKARTEKIFGPPSNRGVAVSGGKVFEATMDGRIIALDAATGKVLWDHEAVRPEEGEIRDRLGPGGHARGRHGPGVEPSRLQDAAAGRRRPRHRRRRRRRLRPARGGRQGRPRRRRGGGHRGRLWPPRLARRLRRRHGRRALALVRDQGRRLGGRTSSATTSDGVPLHRDIAAEKAAAPAHPRGLAGRGRLALDDAGLRPRISG